VGVRRNLLAIQMVFAEFASSLAWFTRPLCAKHLRQMPRWKPSPKCLIVITNHADLRPQASSPQSALVGPRSCCGNAMHGKASWKPVWPLHRTKDFHWTPPGLRCVTLTGVSSWEVEWRTTRRWLCSTLSSWHMSPISLSLSSPPGKEEFGRVGFFWKDGVGGILSCRWWCGNPAEHGAGNLPPGVALGFV
jgi:hypothetical protein